MPLLSPERIKMTKNIMDKFVKSGAQFDTVPYLIELFPAPMPLEIVGIPMRTKLDLIRMSADFGYRELFYTDKDFVTCTFNGAKQKVSRFDFLAWQLQRTSSEYLYFLRDKVDANLVDIFDDAAEMENDQNYDPNSWLFPYSDEMGNFEKGLAYIDRLRLEHPEVLYERLIEAMNDKIYGLLSFLETEINENITAIRKKYKEWVVPLMVVSEGLFMPYIEAGCPENLKMDGFRLDEMWVRNFDEG